MSLAGSLCSSAASAHPLHLISSRSLSSPPLPGPRVLADLPMGLMVWADAQPLGQYHAYLLPLIFTHQSTALPAAPPLLLLLRWLLEKGFLKAGEVILELSFSCADTAMLGAIYFSKVCSCKGNGNGRLFYVSKKQESEPDAEGFSVEVCLPSAFIFVPMM